MDIETAIRRYLTALEKSDFDDLMTIFTEDAYVDSPLYGVQPAADFYRELFQDTKASTIRLKGIFLCVDRPNQAIGYFYYLWTVKDGSRSYFDCIDIFDFVEGRIRNLKIIYDTFHAPPSARHSIPPSNPQF